MAKNLLDGKKIDIMVDGVRRRFTIGSPEFQEWFDGYFGEATAIATRLDMMKDVLKGIPESFVDGMPKNATTGEQAKSGNIDGEYLRMNFAIKTSHGVEAKVDGEDLSAQAALARLHKNLTDAGLTASDYVRTEYKQSAAFADIVKLDNVDAILEDGAISIVEKPKSVAPKWKPIVLKEKATVEVVEAPEIDRVIKIDNQEMTK